MTGPVPHPSGERVGEHRVARVVSTAALPVQAEGLLFDGYRLALVAAHDDHQDQRLRAVYLFLAAAPDRRVELHVHLDPANPRLPSLAAFSFPASRFEREMHDLYGITPLHHPQPRRLVRHPHWPAGWYPMRHDAGEPPTFGTTDEPFPFLTVEGPGVYEIPVGPVHAGLIEPGHFRFSVVGETILKLKARLWYVHKGIERLFQGRDVVAGLPLAERVSGDTAVGHALAYCRAVEDALGLAVSAEAASKRSVLLELERLYNHVGDIGALCNDVGHSILHTHAMRIRERLLRLNRDATGHRLLRDGVHLGGATLRRVPDPTDLAAIGADIREVIDLALTNSLVLERFTDTAVLTAEQVRDVGALGYVARASGVDIDARRDHPTRATDTSNLVVPIHSGGDVLARFRQRAAEIDAALALLDVHLGRISAGTTDVPVAIPQHQLGSSHTSGVGICEGWRGAIVHRVELDSAGRLARVKVVDPSFLTWPALPLALANTIVADFPLVNKSFNLSYAGNDL